MTNERPRKEPEIIPPDRPGSAHPRHRSYLHVSVTTSRGERGLAPGPIGLLLLLIVLSLLVFLLVVLVAGVFLLWIPVLIVALAVLALLALLSDSVRRLWGRRDKP